MRHHHPLAGFPDFSDSIAGIVAGAEQLPNRAEPPEHGPIQGHAHGREVLRKLYPYLDRHLRAGEVEGTDHADRNATLRLPIDGLSYLVHGGRRR